MNLKYMKVSLFEISYKKIYFFRCTCIWIILNIHSLITKHSHNIWRNWERKHKQGKEVVKSIATDMTGTVWSHDITLLFAVFLYIE